VPYVKNDDLAQLETAHELLDFVVSNDGRPCAYNESRDHCETHGIAATEMGCPIALARQQMGYSAEETAAIEADPDTMDAIAEAEDEDDEPAPKVLIRVGPNRQIIEIEDRAWVLAQGEGNNLVLGEETFPAEVIVARTEAMLDSVIAWHDTYGRSPDRVRVTGNRGPTTTPTDLLIDTVEAWREVSGR
jgi:hypothetical protein